MTTAEAASTIAPAPSTTDAARRLGHDPLNRIVAVAVGLFILAVYLITLSPDVSFWDSGEFIATSYSMGIPHPPGTPLYVILGRVFSLVFHSFLHLATPAQAVNMLSAIPSMMAAVFLYLCVVRIGKKMWCEGDQSARCYPAIIAGVTAALFAAFANTLWIDSIEAEVYAVSGMWAIFTTWLILVWADTQPKDERLLVVIAYLLALNIGVHLATYLAALAILPFAFLYEKRLSIPVSFLIVLMMAKDMQFFLLIVALLIAPTLQLALLPSEYKSKHRAALYTGHVIAILVGIIAARMIEPSAMRTVLLVGAPIATLLVPWVALPAPTKLQNPLTDLGFLLVFVTVLGVSCHLYLPIRSALNPAINEAQPDNWRAFWDVILRAQYRPVSVFQRQASWVFQFDNMFWRYFREQWPLRPGWPAAHAAGNGGSDLSSAPRAPLVRSLRAPVPLDQRNLGHQDELHRQRGPRARLLLCSGIFLLRRVDGDRAGLARGEDSRRIPGEHGALGRARRCGAGRGRGHDPGTHAVGVA